MHIYIYIYIYTHTHTYIYIYIHISIHTHIYISISTFTIYISIFIYVHIHVHTYTHTIPVRLQGVAARWVPAVFERAGPPRYDGSAQLFHLRCAGLGLELDAPAAKLRPVWALDSSNPAAPLWTLTRRRTGASGAALLVLRTDGTGWTMEEQLQIPPAQPLHAGDAGAEGAAPTALDAAVARAAADPSAFTLLLRRDDDVWSFGGCGEVRGYTYICTYTHIYLSIDI